MRGLNPPDDIRHRILKRNRERELWEPRKLAEERELPRFLEDTNAYTRKRRRLESHPARRATARVGEGQSEDQYACEYRDGVTAYGAFTYFITKTLFDLGHEHAGTRRKRKFTFQDLVINVGEVMKPYYNQQPQLVGPKAWRKAEVPWKTPRRARPPRRRKR